MDDPIAELPVISHIRCADACPLCQPWKCISSANRHLSVGCPCHTPLQVLPWIVGANAAVDVLSGCRHLFAELQEGPRDSADPTAFAESLNLDRSYQQVSNLVPRGLITYCAQPSKFLLEIFDCDIDCVGHAGRTGVFQAAPESSGDKACKVEHFGTHAHKPLPEQAADSDCFCDLC